MESLKFITGICAIVTSYGMVALLILGVYDYILVRLFDLPVLSFAQVFFVKFLYDLIHWDIVGTLLELGEDELEQEGGEE